MISNEKVINYKVANLFEYYDFRLDHETIRIIWKKLKINFKLFVVALGLENHQYKCFLTNYGW